LGNYPNVNPTTPEGFIEMCKTVKSSCPYYNAGPGYSAVQLSNFSVDAINTSMRWLPQYFAAPKENRDGSLAYLEAQPEYKESLVFLNKLYREKLITDAAFTDTVSTINSNISRGDPFVVFGGYGDNMSSGYFAWNGNRANANRKYVPIVITNSAGDAPILQNISGTGSTLTMVSKNCKRPDRVMKFLDFLSSNEGQRLLNYGVEGEAYVYDIQPGETALNQKHENVTYKYGRIKFTPAAEQLINTNNFWRQYGTLNMLCNSPYIAMINPHNVQIINFADYLSYNTRAALMPYTFKAGLFNISRNPSAYNYKSTVNKASDLFLLWIQNIPKIITANTEDGCLSLYMSTLSTAERYGYKDVLKFDNECFQEMKKYYSIEYAWPPNEPDYVSPGIGRQYIKGYPEYGVEIPLDIYNS